VTEKEEFLRRVVPIALADAELGTCRVRVKYAQHWETKSKEMEKKLRLANNCSGTAKLCGRVLAVIVGAT
jgi:hypothetical protein